MHSLFNGYKFSNYKFTVANNQVTAMDRVIGERTVHMNLPTNATFSVSASGITETITGSKETVVRKFELNAGSTDLYHIGNELITVTNPTTTVGNGKAVFGFNFTLTNGKVTGESITFGATGHTHSRSVPIEPTASFTVNGNTVVETKIHGNQVETITFVKSGDLYAIASDATTYISAGTSTTHLSVNPFERAKFTLDAANHITAVQAVKLDGSTKDVVIKTGMSYTQLAPGYIVETTTRGNKSSYEVFHDGNNDGIYTAVAHGSGTTVDLVGLQAQITTQIHAVL